MPLYFAKERPIVRRNGTLLMVDDDRMPLEEGETPEQLQGALPHARRYPLTGAVESDAETLEDIVAEMRASRTSEREGRVIDHDAAASMEKKKQEGYF